MKDERTQSAHRAQSERWTHGEQCLNALWTQDELFIRSASGVILTLYSVGNQEKIPNELNVQTSAAISLKLTKQFYPIQYPTNYIDPVLSYTIPFMFMNNS